MNRKTISNATHISRRTFLTRAAGLVGTAVAVPAIVPSSVFGAAAPSSRITIGAIGVGRMGMGDLREILGFEEARVVAVCDVDTNRIARAKQTVQSRYAEQMSAGAYDGCAGYRDWRDVIARKDIDAVMVVTPDHWHALPAIAAAKAGKDIFMQKPLSLTIREGREVSDAIKRYNRVFLVGSQQRSDARFRKACELVRNQRIGELKSVKVGFGTDPGTTPQPVMPVPKELDYDMWLGPAPYAPYTEKRVHPQSGYGRPGWLRIRDYGAGMITGWGSHHNDIAQWGMGTEYTGPVEMEGAAEFPADGLWDVHGRFHIEYTYANGVKVTCADNRENKQGVLFEGTDGWVYVRRGHIDANPKSLLDATTKPDETHLYVSNNHKQNWLDCIKSRQPTVAPAEVAHRSCSVCLLGDIAMQLQRKLRWDPEKETFLNDQQANRMLFRPRRSPWRA